MSSYHFIPGQLQCPTSSQGSQCEQSWSDDTDGPSDAQKDNPKPSTIEEGKQIYSREGCKIFLLAQMSANNRWIIKRSLGLHQQLQVEFYKLLLNDPKQHLIKIGCFINHPQKLLVKMEYACNGDLHQIITNTHFAQMYHNNINKRVQWVRQVSRQVVLGLQQIHNMGYVYRDLKPSNIVITHTRKLKLCDYGLVGLINTIDPSLCGTCEYMPPERLIEKKRNTMPLDTSIDAWGLGVFMFELLMGKTPFPYQDSIDQYIEEMYNGFIELDERYPSECRHLILNLLQTNPRKRLQMHQILEHPFFKDHGGLEMELMEGFNKKCDCRND